jgi:hypothetical protein
MRIKAATTAFGALNSVLTSLSVDLRVKGRIYNALVLSIFLFGSEAWFLQEDIFNRLRSFHNRCVRSMRRITMAHMIKHRITSKSLFERLGVFFRQLLQPPLPCLCENQAPARQLLTKCRAQKNLIWRLPIEGGTGTSATGADEMRLCLGVLDLRS